MALFNMRALCASRPKRGGARVRVSELGIEEYHAYLENKERKNNIRQYDKAKALLDSIQKEHLPSINHMLLYDRIYGFLERNKYLTKVYQIMLKKLVASYPFDEIVVHEYLWDSFHTG